MMMQNLDDNLFQDLLSDYATPVSEDGFSDTVLNKINAEARKVERIRKISIYSACFVGGMSAATQFSSLMGLVSKISITTPQLSTIDAAAIPVWGFAGIILFGFVLWAVLDRQVFEIF